MTRHEASSPMSPLTVRASRIPMSSPLMTVPTTRPRSSSPASEEASGTSTCAATDVSPSSARPPASAAKDGAIAQTAAPMPLRTSRVVTRPRRSRRSPSGTRSASPTT